MRAIAMAVLLALAASSAPAADWGHYVNARFGFAVDVPPGFAAQGESYNGDGNRFTTPTAELRAFASNIAVGEADFETEVGYEQSAWTDKGWTITYQATTPRNAVFSGRKGARVVYERLVAICGGAQFMGFLVEYSVPDLQRFNAVIDRLTTSLRPPATC
jgi:hypothetical protein